MNDLIMTDLAPRRLDLEKADLTVFCGIASARHDPARGSFQIAEIGRDRLDLRFGQIMRDRSHDGRCVRFVLVLASLLFPVGEFPEHVIMELSCQTRKGVAAFGVVPVTGSTWRNLGLGNSFLIDLPSLRRVLFWRPT